MSEQSRRDVLLTGAAGLVAGTKSPATEPIEQGVPFSIEPTERFLEIRRLQKVLAAADGVDRKGFAEAWNRITALQSEMSDVPRTPAELLEYATIMLFWNTAIADGGLDPCEALMRSRAHRHRSHAPEQTAVDLAMAVFALAGYRATSDVQWPNVRVFPDNYGS